MSKEDRAKQFLPFNSLRGYYDLINEEKRIKEQKKILSEEDYFELEKAFREVSVGKKIIITFYNKDHYEKIEGMVAKIDLSKRQITIVDRIISLDSIIKINI